MYAKLIMLTLLLELITDHKSFSFFETESGSKYRVLNLEQLYFGPPC